MSNIQKLKRSIKGKRASKNYKQVNKSIDKIIRKGQNGNEKEKIKALICQLEGNSNQANAYTVMGICYSFAIGAFSIIDIVGSEGRVLFGIILSVVVILASVAIRIKYNGYKEAFILKALNFRLEELNNENPSVKNDLTEKTEPGLK